jgi:anti-sigma B factor antagonist
MMFHFLLAEGGLSTYDRGVRPVENHAIQRPAGLRARRLQSERNGSEPLKSVKIGNETEGGIQILDIDGFMDMREVPKFEKAVEDLIKTGHHRIVLDMTDLEYISSAGLGTIIGSIRKVRSQGGDIKVGGVSLPVMDILKTFGFTQVFETYASRREAVQKFGA